MISLEARLLVFPNVEKLKQSLKAQYNHSNLITMNHSKLEPKAVFSKRHCFEVNMNMQVTHSD